MSYALTLNPNMQTDMQSWTQPENNRVKENIAVAEFSAELQNLQMQ